MAQIYYFCFNYWGVSFFSRAKRPGLKKAGLRAVAFFSAAAEPAPKKRAPTMHSALTQVRHQNKASMKIEHLGIAVKSLETSDRLFARLLGQDYYKQESVQREGVTTSFYSIGESKIELLEATNPESPIAKFLDKKGEGIHHIAFGVEDIYAEIARLKKEGFIFISEEPKDGADNKLVVFLHPKSTNGVLVELCQEKPEK
jgi:methylmalonyl-CoA/ethylmalonyl-CoA epimerase